MHAPAEPWPVVDAPELAALVRDADHVDVASTTAAASLAEFVTAALSWEPAWLRALYRARAVLVRILRLDHPDLSASADPHEQTLSLVPGTAAGFFTVTDAAEDHYVVLAAADTHLTAYLVVVADKREPYGRRRFRLVTIVHHHRWTGHVYFTLIRTFHHLVVKAMTRATVRECQRTHGRSTASADRGHSAAAAARPPMEETSCTPSA